jgi:hypothetical protein
VGRNERGSKSVDSCAVLAVLLLAGLTALIYGASQVVGTLVG